MKKGFWNYLFFEFFKELCVDPDVEFLFGFIIFLLNSVIGAVNVLIIISGKQVPLIAPVGVSIMLIISFLVMVHGYYRSRSK